MDQIKSNLKAVVGSSKAGILLSNLEVEYRRITSCAIDYRSYGFNDLKSFIESISDVVRLRMVGANEYMVYLMTSSDDPQCLKKLCSLIQHTKSKKPTKCGKGFNNNNYGGSIPKNVYEKSQNNFNNLTISVANDHFGPDSGGHYQGNGHHNSYQQAGNSHHYGNSNNNNYHHNHYNNYNNNHLDHRNLSQSVTSTDNTSYRQAANVSRSSNANCAAVSNGSAPTANAKAQAIATAATIPGPTRRNTNAGHNASSVSQARTLPVAGPANSANNTSRNSGSAVYGRFHRNGVGQPLVSIDLTNQSDNDQWDTDSVANQTVVSVIAPVANHRAPETAPAANHKPPMANGDSSLHIHLWPLNYVNTVRVLHRQVRVHGVLGGYALVSLLDSLPPSYYIDCDPVDNAFLGDALLWQPPIPDSRRSKRSVDSATVMPVILVDRLPGARMKVRLMGVQVVVEVNVGDLHKFPKTQPEIQVLRSEFTERQMTVVRLAGVPAVLECWDQSLLTDLYFSPAFVNNEYIFERCAKRGDFLNVMLLLHFLSHDLPRQSVVQRRSFVDHLMRLVDQCRLALVPKYEFMVRNKGVVETPENSVLSVIDSNIACDNKMLIGCPLHFAHTGSGKADYHYTDSECRLERIIYQRRMNSFHYFDDNLAPADVVDKAPIFGLYMLNENFVNSRQSDISKLRFEVAMLLYIPDYYKLKNTLLGC